MEYVGGVHPATEESVQFLVTAREVETAGQGLDHLQSLEALRSRRDAREGLPYVDRDLSRPIGWAMAQEVQRGNIALLGVFGLTEQSAAQNTGVSHGQLIEDVSSTVLSGIDALAAASAAISSDARSSGRWR